MNNTYEDALRNLDGDKNNEEKNLLENLENNSLGKIGPRIDYTKDAHEETKRLFGYFDLFPENFPSEGKFYPKDMKIKIKAATVKEIREFSSLDENNPYEVDEAIIDLLTTCTRVSFSDRVGSWKDILEEDRLYLILSIRELTFAEQENIISFPVKCESCGADNKMEIKNENFQHRQIDSTLMRYYSEQDLCFNVETKSFGTIKIKPPVAGIMRHVSKYIKSLKDKNVNIKEYISFLKVLPYMIQDWRGVTDKTIDNLRIEFLGWSPKKFSTFNQLCELAQVSVQEKMLKHCDKCGDPIEAKVELPTGIKGLFVENDILGSELL
jgi:hypothetical protein